MRELNSREKPSRREIKKNMKYMFDYETTEVSSRRMRSQQVEIETQDRNGAINEKTTDEIGDNIPREIGKKKSDDNEEIHGQDTTLVNGVENTNEDSQDGKLD